MKYQEIIQALSNSLLKQFDEIYHNAEIVTNDKGIKQPVISKNDEWISLVPTDQNETIYIRRNGDDEVLENMHLSSCRNEYKMRTSLRIVYFRDHIENHNEIITNLIQSVLISGTKLKSVIRDKWKLQKDESSGDYNFGATTAYFAIDIYAIWNLVIDTCETDYCVEIGNPLKREPCPVVA